ncbi:MAG: cysteine--tRNA ligase [Frankiaceae bacterium]
MLPVSETATRPPLRLYDTRARGPQEIVPAVPGRFRMYACGPTVYRDAHVGNLRSFLLRDLIARVGEVLHGWQVEVVQNITDVGHLQDDTLDEGEDKMLAAARREGRSPLELARTYEAAFHRDLAALNISPADAYPRASECIPIMLRLIETLLTQGHAYVGADGSVFFDARSFPSYGELSGNRVEELRPGHGASGQSTAAGKRFHADWALWKSAGSSGTLVYDSPWGPGFPGWHVECSAMSLEYLGSTVDVHTGGIDLRFPHHEDERAQSNCAAGREVVRYWVHGEHLLFEGRKMAKSSGNVVLLADLVTAGHDPLALRLFFLQGRYRQQLNLTWEALAAADRTLTRWRTKVAEWAESPSKPIAATYRERIEAALNDDLDTPAALVALRQLERDPEVAAGAKFETFAAADRVLGLDVVAEVGKPPDTVTLPAEAEAMLAERAAARVAKDFATSDRLRDALAGLGVVVTDTPAGQTWTASS